MFLWVMTFLANRWKKICMQSTLHISYSSYEYPFKYRFMRCVDTYVHKVSLRERTIVRMVVPSTFTEHAFVSTQFPRIVALFFILGLIANIFFTKSLKVHFLILTCYFYDINQYEDKISLLPNLFSVNSEVVFVS